jgi:gamma-glutamyltranspeptidase/glutathione hydrolase
LALQSAYRERDADGRRALSAEHLAPACTTHFSVVDRSTFGSKYVLQQSGVP